MKRGPKPRQITKEFLEKIEHLAARGLSQQQVCDALGFSETWWYEAEQKNPEITDWSSPQKVVHLLVWEINPIRS